VATDDCDNIVPECPQSSLANSRSRPFSDIRCPDRVATKPPLGPMHGYPKTRSTFWTLNTSSTSSDSLDPRARVIGRPQPDQLRA